MPRTLIAVVIFFISLNLVAQKVPSSDPFAVSLAQKSIAILTAGGAITDVTLNAKVTLFVGPDSETGPAILQASGLGKSRLDLSLPSGTRTGIRNDSLGYPQGASSLNNGKQHAWALHNCWTDASWFFPALSRLASTSDLTVIFSYLGQETRNGVSVEHIQTYRNMIDPFRAATTTLTQSLSTTDFYLDSSSLLPVAVAFNSHPDNDDGMDIVMTINFANYQQVNGFQVPFSIQEFMFGGLVLDISITGATINSGISDSVFAIQ